MEGSMNHGSSSTVTSSHAIDDGHHVPSSGSVTVSNDNSNSNSNNNNNDDEEDGRRLAVAQVPHPLEQSVVVIRCDAADHWHWAWLGNADVSFAPRMYWRTAAPPCGDPNENDGLAESDHDIEPPLYLYLPQRLQTFLYGPVSELERHDAMEGHKQQHQRGLNSNKYRMRRPAGGPNLHTLLTRQRAIQFARLRRRPCLSIYILGATHLQEQALRRTFQGYPCQLMRFQDVDFIPAQIFRHQQQQSHVRHNALYSPCWASLKAAIALYQKEPPSSESDADGNANQAATKLVPPLLILEDNGGPLLQYIATTATANESTFVNPDRSPSSAAVVVASCELGLLRKWRALIEAMPPPTTMSATQGQPGEAPTRMNPLANPSPDQLRQYIQPYFQQQSDDPWIDRAVLDSPPQSITSATPVPGVAPTAASSTITTILADPHACIVGATVREMVATLHRIVQAWLSRVIDNDMSTTNTGTTTSDDQGSSNNNSNVKPTVLVTGHYSAILEMMLTRPDQTTTPGHTAAAMFPNNTFWERFTLRKVPHLAEMGVTQTLQEQYSSHQQNQTQEHAVTTTTMTGPTNRPLPEWTSRLLGQRIRLNASLGNRTGAISSVTPPSQTGVVATDELVPPLLSCQVEVVLDDEDNVDDGHNDSGKETRTLSMRETMDALRTYHQHGETFSAPNEAWRDHMQDRRSDSDKVATEIFLVITEENWRQKKLRDKAEAESREKEAARQRAVEQDAARKADEAIAAAKAREAGAAKPSAEASAVEDSQRIQDETDRRKTVANITTAPNNISGAANTSLEPHLTTSESISTSAPASLDTPLSGTKRPLRPGSIDESVTAGATPAAANEELPLPSAKKSKPLSMEDELQGEVPSRDNRSTSINKSMKMDDGNNKKSPDHATTTTVVDSVEGKVHHTRQSNASESSPSVNKSRKDDVVDPLSYVKRRVAKWFGPDLYFGSIVDYRPPEENVDNEPLWSVVYDDEDTEDYNRKELFKHLGLAKKHAKKDFNRK